METIAPWVYTIDIVGTFVFAISGALAASEKRFDIFGANPSSSARRSTPRPAWPAPRYSWGWNGWTPPAC